MTRPGIEPRSPGPLANTLTARPIKLKLPLVGAISFISTIVFRGLNTLVILNFLNVIFIN